jgi:uncharacterized protein YndB with AHSA1/START domain
MAEYRASIEIDAPPEQVFEFLVTDDGLTSWMGQWASLDARKGGRFAVDIAGYPVRGAFLEIDRPRRVTISWGFAGSSDMPPGSSTVSFELVAIPAGTRVDVAHTNLPEARVAGHRSGWGHFLARFVRAAQGEHLPPDTWKPTDDIDDSEGTSHAQLRS